jgi:hypothetical protein
MWEAGREGGDGGMGEEVGLRVYVVREGGDVGVGALLLFLDEDARVMAWFCQL